MYLSILKICIQYEFLNILCSNIRNTIWVSFDKTILHHLYTLYPCFMLLKLRLLHTIEFIWLRILTKYYIFMVTYILWGCVILFWRGHSVKMSLMRLINKIIIGRWENIHCPDEWKGTHHSARKLSNILLMTDSEMIR